jgi:hypothetical protein
MFGFNYFNGVLVGLVIGCSPADGDMGSVTFVTL